VFGGGSTLRRVDGSSTGGPGSKSRKKGVWGLKEPKESPKNRDLVKGRKGWSIYPRDSGRREQSRFH